MDARNEERKKLEQEAKYWFEFYWCEDDSDYSFDDETENASDEDLKEYIAECKEHYEFMDEMQKVS